MGKCNSDGQLETIFGSVKTSLTHSTAKDEYNPMFDLYRFCFSCFSSSKVRCGVDEQGVVRKPGDSWQEECNRCRCLPSGVPGCTKKLCGTILDTTLQPDTADIKTREQESCGVDEQGEVRKPGDNWQEECNRCRCLPSGVPGCTKKLCGSVPGFVDPEEKTCKDSNG